MSQKLEKGFKELAPSASIGLSLKMERIDLSPDPNMILRPDIIRIIDQDMTDSNLLDNEENPDTIKTIYQDMTDSNLL